MCKTDGTQNTHLVPLSVPGILCLLGSDYFANPRAGFAGVQINYAARAQCLAFSCWPLEGCRLTGDEV